MRSMSARAARPARSAPPPRAACRAEQGRVAAQLLAHHLVGRLGPFALELPVEELVEQVERGVRREPGAQQLVALRHARDDRRRPRRARRRGRDSSDPGSRCASRASSASSSRPWAACRSPSSRLARTQRRLTSNARSRCLRVVVARVRQRRGGELAVEVGDLGVPHHAFMAGQRLGDLDRLRPVLLLLVDLEQVAQRDVVGARPAQAQKGSLGGQQLALRKSWPSSRAPAGDDPR